MIARVSVKDWREVAEAAAAFLRNIQSSEGTAARMARLEKALRKVGR
jgi:hypothetical protein